MSIAVIGGGDGAVGEALHLVPLARHVTLIHHRPRLRALAIAVARLRAHPNVAIFISTKVLAVQGGQFLPRSSRVPLDKLVRRALTRHTRGGQCSVFPDDVDGASFWIAAMDRSSSTVNWYAPSRMARTSLAGMATAPEGSAKM
jgi:Pyridine nucleotide-disulphide oxidoreductase